VSVADPVIVTGTRLERVAFAAGEVIEEVGALVSVEAVAATSPDCKVAGCACMSARILTVAC
jgi:uncharacterized protein YbaA (DUF1428 family)